MALPGTSLYSISHVKISKKDINGDDVTSIIENLLYFTLKYTDIGLVQFIIEDKTEYDDYYLFKIKLTPYNQSTNINTLASSSDNNILDYKILASSNTTQTSSILTYDDVTTDILGYLTASDGYYTLHNTPNVPLIISASATLYSDNGTQGTEIRLYRKPPVGGLQGITGFSSTQVSLSPASSATLYLSGSLLPIKGETYVVAISDDSPDDTDITASFATFKVTQSYANPNVGVSGSGDELIITTSLPEDQDPLYGNADLIVLNPRYIALNYVEYTIPEEEFSLILSGFGTNSTVKQYNYELLRSILPRYIGSRTVSNDFNLNTLEANPYQNIYSGVGLKPNVERTTPYFLYFGRMVNTSPILKDKVTLELKYLIDENGEAYNLNTQVPIYQNLIGSFEVGKKAYASFINNASNIYINTQSILLSGQFYQPILYNLSSSTNIAWSPQLNFVNLDGSSGSGVPNFNSVVTFNQEVDLRNNDEDYEFNLLSFGQATGTENSSNGSWSGNPLPTNSTIFTFNNDAESPVTIRMRGDTYAGADIGLELRVEIYKKSTGGSFVLTNTTTVVTPGSGGTRTYQLIYDNNSQGYVPRTGDQFYFKFIKLSAANQYSQIVKAPTIEIITSRLTAPSPSKPYWYILPNNPSIITASEDLTNCYQQYIQKPIADSGFIDNKTIFNILPGDEFRFEYQEDQNSVYKIIKAEVTNSIDFAPSRLYVTLDKPITATGSIDINNFTIRRKNIDVGNGITLDAPFIANTGAGFLFPQYPSDKIKNNLPTIISDLQQKGLI